MPHIDVETLQTWLAEGRPIMIVDVRKDATTVDWAIPGSVPVDAYDALKAGDPHALDSLAVPPDTTVVTVCGVGRASETASMLLRQQGVEAYSLTGGMKAWSLAWNQATVRLSDPSTRVIQIRRTGKGCLSYLIGSGDEAAVLDASLDPALYLELAQAAGWRITTVLDTHIHADHLSRGRALAEQARATLLLPHQQRVAYPFTALHDGGTFSIGAARLTAVHTPGHTQESMCYVLNEQAIFTGDTLFLSGVGRPDLHADRAEADVRSRALYRSLQRLRAYPPEMVILPGHTNMPAAFDGEPLQATLAAIMAQVALLQHNEAAFSEALLARLPLTPPNHERISELNEAGIMPDDPTELEAGANRCAIA